MSAPAAPPPDALPPAPAGLPGEAAAATAATGARRRGVRAPRWHVNPTFVREVRARLRGWRAFLLQFLVLLFVLGPFLGYWAQGIAEPYSINRDILHASGMGLRLFIALFLGLASVSGLVLALHASAGFVGEYQADTFDLLITTRQTFGALVRGKIASALFAVGWLVLSCLPALVLCTLLGGVTFATVVRLLADLALVLVAFAAVGTFCSIWFRHAVASNFATLLLCAAIGGMPVAAAAALADAVPGARSLGVQFLAPLFKFPDGPVAAWSLSVAGYWEFMAALGDPSLRAVLGGPGGGPGALPVGAPFWGYWALVTLVFYVFSVRLLHRRAWGIGRS